MARQRPPIACNLPFTYWVFGRPVSTQNADGSKPAALARWRGTVTTALVEAVETVSKGRGLIPIERTVEIRIAWLSVDPFDPSHPDLDNVLKPLIDAFNTRVIADDRQVHRIRAAKASVNAPPASVEDVMAEIENDPRFVAFGEVTIVRLLDVTPEKRP